MKNLQSYTLFILMKQKQAKKKGARSVLLEKARELVKLSRNKEISDDKKELMRFDDCAFLVQRSGLTYRAKPK